MSTDVFSTFENEVESRHAEMLNDLESISIDDLKSDGLSLSFGGKTFKFTDLEIVQDEVLEDKLRAEYKEKLNTQQQRIREKINSKINQLLLMHQQKQGELEKKERQLKSKYKNMAMMPEITEEHMLKGLSVVKGVTNDQLVWIYRAKYNPRFIIIAKELFSGSRKERKPIPARLVTRLKKDILILLTTKGDKITSVATKKTKRESNQLPAFPHYHQTGEADCWGSWTYPERWSNVNDIVKVVKDAEAVLESINQGSVANRGPAGLPRMKTLLEAVEDVTSILPTTDESNDDNEDVWQS